MALVSCEKVIDIDYHDADSRYVVEGSLSATGTEVRVSKTNAMDDNSTGSDVDNAVVVITGDDGTTATIPFIRNGYYRSKFKGIPGTQYQLDVKVDGHHFTSTSTMQRTPRMNEFRLVWKKMLTERYLFGDLRLQDIPNENNWYFMHIYRNGIGYRWAVMKDERILIRSYSSCSPSFAMVQKITMCFMMATSLRLLSVPSTSAPTIICTPCSICRAQVQIRLKTLRVAVWAISQPTIR